MSISHYKWALVVFFFLSLSQTRAAQEVSKNIHKNYKVSASTKIAIDNRFGRVHINTWDKNEVEVDINITAKGHNDDRSNEVLNAINIDIEDSNPSSYLAFETKTGQMKGNASFSIDYTVSMPTANALELENNFGDVYLQKLSGNLEITVKYGQLIAEQLTGNTALHLSFGKGESDIAFLSSGDLDVRYSKLNIHGAGKLSLNSQFSDVQMGKASAMQLDGKYGSFKIDEIDQLAGDLEFSGLKLGKLNNSLTLDSRHGNGLDIGRNRPHFKLIDLTNEFSSITLNLPHNVNATLDLAIKFGDLRTSGGGFNFTTVKKDNTSSEYKGNIGSSNAQAKIIVDTKYGNVSLKGGN